jgi:hypothetical protein
VPRLATLCRDLIRPRDEVLSRAAAFATANFQGRRVVGVHYASSEESREFALRITDGSGVLDAGAAADPDRYLDVAARAIGGADAAIFIVTGDAEALDRTRDRSSAIA